MKSKNSRRLELPEGIKPGDTLAVIRPAAALESEKFENSVRWIREAGFFVATYPGNFPVDSYFASSDDNRAKEWAWAFSQPGVRAILSCRAGYGVMRTLFELDCLKFKPRAKILLGYSDMTFAHHWNFNRWSQVGFHGPLVGHLEREDLHYLLDQLVHLPTKASESVWEEIDIEQKGVAIGTLVGGNLSLFQTSGPAALPQRPLILAVEEVREDYYRIDRMIWSLIHAGYQKWVKGMILGSFEACGKDVEKFPFERVLESCRKLCKGPIWTNANFGHGLKRQRILPIGAKVEMKAKTLKIKHAQVREKAR